MGSPSAHNVQHWRISTRFNTVTQIYSEKKQWFLGLPRMIYPSIVRIRALLNSIPQDSLVSGALWILFEIDAPEYTRSEIKFILVSLLVCLIKSDHPTVDVDPEAEEYLRGCVMARSVDRYLTEVQTFMRLRQPVQLSHIIVRSIAYKGLDGIVSPSSALPAVKLLITVCNARIGQLDQSYFSPLSPGGGIIAVNQSVNATDEIIFSLYVREFLVCRFQTVGFALIDVEKGPLKLLDDDFSNLEMYKEINDPSFFIEVFAECLQWMGQSETGGTSIAHGTAFTENNTMNDSEAILNVAHRLQPQSGVQLTKEEKYSIVLSALPTFNYRPLERQVGESDEEYILRTQCQICLGDYKEGDQVRALPCMHAFHASCTEDWLHVRLQCPNCLADMVLLLSSPAETIAPTSPT